ncbi:FAD/NAD(P)-binding domain-containing protein [Serendipita vermifera]|nr:FAD/NAD(P)-binding domain-containing protein [Serendipita vermifera]
MSYKVIIIGSGWSGLAAAKTYLQIDPSINLTVLESEDSLGGTWSSSRIFPELLTQQSYNQYVYPDMPYDPSNEPPCPGNYIPSHQVHRYLNQYAERWGIKDKIRFGVTAEKCQRAPDGVKWELHLQRKDKETEMAICDKLIVATGLTSQPNLPEISSENFTPLHFHSRYLGQNYPALRSPGVNTVCVYGGGKSAYDSVAAAINNGKRVHWIIRDRDGGGMPAIYKPDLFGRPTVDKPFTPVNNLLLPDITATGHWSHRFFHSGKNWLGSWFSWWYWGLLSRTLLSVWKYDENENMKKLKPDRCDHSFYWCAPLPFAVPDETIVNHIREGKTIAIHKAEITRLSGRQVHLSDGTTVETDMLVYATGWQTVIPIFSEEDSLALGLPVRIDRLSSLDPDLRYPSTASQRAEELVLQQFPRLADPPIPPRAPTYTQYRLYRTIVPLPMVKADDRSLAFVGYLHGVGTAVITDVVALWAVAWLTGETKVSRKMEEIEWEVDLYNAYIRRRYLISGRHLPHFLYDWFSITKNMLTELKVPLPQKSIFKPWLPADYGGIVQKWISIHLAWSKGEDLRRRPILDIS